MDPAKAEARVILEPEFCNNSNRPSFVISEFEPSLLNHLQQDLFSGDQIRVLLTIISSAHARQSARDSTSR